MHRTGIGDDLCINGANGGAGDFAFDLDGHWTLRYNSSGGACYSEVYLNGRHVATSGGDLKFVHTDWLGTTRYSVDYHPGTSTNGVFTLWPASCTGLPFGDGLSCTGYSSSLHFTGQERDSESGLDNFGARYDSSSMGRFMSPDPLLNSGRPWEPQSWNRYAYALNNPLNIIDPTGLYDLVNNCAADDKKCNKQFRQHADELKKGLSDLQKKVDKMKDSPEKQRLQAALTVLGTEGDHNGVNATFGALSGSAAAQTDYNTAANGQLSATITFDPSKNSDSTAYGINGAHEGTHIEDTLTGLLDAYDNASRPDWLRSPLPTLSPFSVEYRGYQTSAWAAQAFGSSNISYRGIQIWNSSWGAADRQTLQDRAITNVVVDKDHPETTPHNPWPW
jgi:RHS repeat-associated protein